MATQHTLKFKKLRSSTLNRKRRTKSKILLREQSTYLKEHSKHYSYSLLSRSPKKNLREVSNVNFINNQKIQKPSIAVIESKPTDYNAIENRKPYALDFALVECIPNDFDIFIQEEDETSTVNIFPTKPSNHKLQKKSNKKLTQNNKSKSCLHISEVNEVTPSDVIGIVDEDLSTTTINFPPSREKHHCVDNTIKKSCISHSGVSRLRRIESEIDESLKSQIYTDVVSAINSVITELLPNKYAKKVNIIFKNINNDSESKCNGNEFSGSGIAYDNNMHSSSSDSKDDTLKVTIELEALRNGSINKVSLDQNVRSNNSSRSLAVHGDVSRNVKTEDCISINCNSAYNSIAKTYIAAIQLINEDIKTGTETSIFEVSDFAQSTKKLMKHISDSIVNNDTKHEEISEESIPLIYDAEVGDVLEISSDNLNQTSNSNDTRLFTNSYPYFTIEDEELSPNSIAKNADDRKHGRFMAVIGSGIDSGEDSSIIEEQISYNDECPIQLKSAADYKFKQKIVIITSQHANRALLNFVVPLRHYCRKRNALKPLVFMLENKPSEVFIEAISCYPQVYYCTGSINRLSDLLIAGINHAETVFIVGRNLNHHVDEDYMTDAATIVAVQKMFKIFPGISIITELHHPANMRFMQFRAQDFYALHLARKKSRRNVSDASYLFRLPFIAGRVYSASMLDTLLYQSYAKPYLINLIGLLLGLHQQQGSGHLSCIHLNDTDVNSLRVFGKLFQKLSSTTYETPIGIYRIVKHDQAVENTKKFFAFHGHEENKRITDEFFTWEREDIAAMVRQRMSRLNMHTDDYDQNVSDKRSHLSYVIVNPEYNCKLLQGDIVYVLRPPKKITSNLPQRKSQPKLPGRKPSFKRGRKSTFSE